MLQTIIDLLLSAFIIAECAPDNTAPLYERVCDGTPNCDRCVDECHCNSPGIVYDKRDVGSSVRERQTSDSCRSQCGEETAAGASCLINPSALITLFNP